MKIITENIFKNTSLNQVIVTLALAFVFIMNVSEKISTLLLVTLFVVSLFNIKNFDIQRFKPVSVLIVLFSIYIATHFLMDEVFSIKTLHNFV